jgi:ADP-ribose pyrophosphatase YjhB (NUDIX family)
MSGQVRRMKGTYLGSPRRTARPYAAAGVLFLDELGRVLLVEPTYKDQHDIPGGMIEPGETPRQACVREIEEELGLSFNPGRLLVVDSQVYPTGEDVLLFIFDGGILGSDRLSQVRLDRVELKGVLFVAEPDLPSYVPQYFAARLGAALAARDNNTVYDLERGDRVDQ